MVSENQHINTSHNVDKNIGIQILEVLQIIAELLLVILQCFYFNLESVYRIFVPPPEKSVRGEIVLITGAGHGIGKEIALQYGALGATVVAWDINAKNNEETVKEIKQNGSKAYGYICDVSNRDMVFETVEKVKKDVGDVTIIVNNAGIMPTHNLLDHTKEEIEKMFGINVLGHFWILQAILPTMYKSNHGHIVAISSCAGIFGLENLVPYCGTKFAVRGMMEALYYEINKKPNCQIKLTTICPYMVDTGLCKRPKVRFASTMNMMPPAEVAKLTIDAQRRNLKEVTIPKYFSYLNNVFRTGSANAANKLKRFLDVGLESDL